MLFYLFFPTAGNSHVETASIAGGAVLSLVLFSVITFFVYLKKHTKKPNEFEVESQRVIERYWWNSMMRARRKKNKCHRRSKARCLETNREDSAFPFFSVESRGHREFNADEAWLLLFFGAHWNGPQHDMSDRRRWRRNKVIRIFLWNLLNNQMN